MTILDILIKSAAAMGAVKSVLQSIVKQYPDTADKLQPIIDGLDAPVAQDNLVALATALPSEIAKVVSGKVDPRPHAGDAI